MKLPIRLALLASLCAGVGESPTLEAHPLAVAQLLSVPDAPTVATTTLDQWPGGNRKARKITRKSRRRTFLKTRGSAVKTMFARKKQARGYRKASQQGFNKADKSKAPPKRAGCNG